MPIRAARPHEPGVAKDATNEAFRPWEAYAEGTSPEGSIACGSARFEGRKFFFAGQTHFSYILSILIE